MVGNWTGHGMFGVISIGGHKIGDRHPVFITAEIGINHNGNVEVAEQLIDAASAAGCTATKFQKRTPDRCVPQGQKERLRQTPWGLISYIEYRQRLEFGAETYHRLSDHCRQRSILFFASCWDEDAIEFMARFDPPCYKVPSACLTNDTLLHAVRAKGKPVILSTGMSTQDQVDHAVNILGIDNLLILQCTSTYPTRGEEINLRVIPTYQKRYKCPVGYSGHELGTQATLAAVALGACYIERHITLDRSMWGSDHMASLEPSDFKELVREIHTIETAMGDGRKTLYKSEIAAMERLRAVR